MKRRQLVFDTGGSPRLRVQVWWIERRFDDSTRRQVYWVRDGRDDPDWERELTEEQADAKQALALVRREERLARRRPAVPDELRREAKALGYSVTWNAALRKWDVREA